MDVKTVLFVDDEVNILNSLVRLLRREPYQVVVAKGAKEAFEILEKQPVQVVISDQKMPDMLGTEFLQKVKDQYPHTVRVILSGHADINLLIDSINKDEVYRFLTKPWNDQEVKMVIKQCMTHYDLAQKNRSMTNEMRDRNNNLSA
jgi:DNA-binding NtrC family response regulator